MQIQIRYCGACGYRGRAENLASQILAARATPVELVAADGGVFDVLLDGAIVVSKRQLGRFPTDAEVLDGLEAHATPG